MQRERCALSYTPENDTTNFSKLVVDSYEVLKKSTVIL